MRKLVLLLLLGVATSATAQNDDANTTNPAKTVPVRTTADQAAVIHVTRDVNGALKVGTHVGVVEPVTTGYREESPFCVARPERSDVPAVVFQNDSDVPVIIRMVPTDDQLKTGDASCKKACAIPPVDLPEGTLTGDCGKSDDCSVDLKKLAGCDSEICNSIRVACTPDTATTCKLMKEQFTTLTRRCDSQCGVTRVLPKYVAPDATKSRITANAATITTNEFAEFLPSLKELKKQGIAMVAAQKLLDTYAPKAVFDSDLFTRTSEKSKKPILLSGPFRFIVADATPDVKKPARIGVSVDLAVPSSPQCQLLAAPATISARAAVVTLDNTGVVNWRYQNPRNPACLTCGGGPPVGVAFYNRTADRTFSVSLVVPKEQAAAAIAAGAFNVCKANKPCKITVNVPPQNTQIFDSTLLAALPKTLPLRFDVSFFDETEKPAFPSAYFRQTYLTKTERDEQFKDPNAPLMAEPDGGPADFSVIAKITGALDPYLPAPPSSVTKDTLASVKCPSIPEDQRATFDPTKYNPDRQSILCVENPYEGGYRRHYSSLGRLEMRKALGTRADAFVALSYRDETDLGVKDLPKASAPQYYVNVNSLVGLALQFGRNTFAADSAGGLAFVEKGDGFRISFPYGMSLSHIIKRESKGAGADRANNDAKSYIFQAKALPIDSLFIDEDEDERADAGQPRRNANNPLRALRSLDLTAIRGVDKLTHVYETYGGELFYAVTNIGCHGDLKNCSRPPSDKLNTNFGNVAGSVAFYKSSRHLRLEPDCTKNLICRDAAGYTGLVTATYTPAVRLAASGVGFETVRSYTLRYGLGSGDRSSSSRDHGYVGETASYAPDSLFLSLIGPAIDSKANRVIGAALSNKRYWGFQYVDNTVSPLEWLLMLIRISKDDIAGKATIFKYHDYRFRYPVSGEKQGGKEYDMEFNIESPQGVKVTVSGGYLMAGAALKPFVKKNPWVLSSSISLKF